MPYSISVVDPRGGLDTNSDLAKVREGDYTGSLNIQHLTDKGQTSFAIQNSKGNLLRFTIPATTQQNKTYRIHLGADNATSHTITFYWTSGAVMAPATFTEGASIGATITNLETAVNTALAAATPAQTVSYAIGSNYIDITITTVMGYNWGLATDSFGAATITQEAYSLDMCGEANIIGSYDLLGDLIIWSTPRTTLPTVLSVPITGATNASPIVITAVGNGLTAGQEVSISGILGSTGANGTWIVSVVDADHFQLKNSSAGGVYVSGGTITTNVIGIGEVGAAVYDANTDTTAYTTLVKSREFNFTTKKQIATYAEENNFERSIYWTDDYNIPRVFYYSGAFVTNGAITIINPAGIYAYGSIYDETKLILTQSLLEFAFTQQYAAGGGILSGNWRYAIRLLTKTLSATNWTELSNPINVYRNSQNGSLEDICGDDAGTVTPKINEFSVTGIPVGAFFYIELAAVNYVNGAIVGYIVNRIQIDGTSMIIQHTGNETAVQNLDVSTLNTVSFDIETAKNINAIDNRLILSNLTTSQEKDFTSFAETWTHNLFRRAINGIGDAGFGNERYGEYQVPENVYSHVGYMLNDVYRFGVKFRLKSTGNYTKVFWIDDIKFDTSTTNICTFPSGSRRISPYLTDYNLSTSGFPQQVWVYNLVFNYDLNFLVDGVSVRDLIESMHIERVERVKEVLCTGIMLPLLTGFKTNGSSNIYRFNSAATDYGENTFAAGIPGGASTGFPTNTLPTYPYMSGFSQRVVKFYSPDIYCGNTSEPSAPAGGADVILNYGNPEFVTIDSGEVVVNQFVSTTVQYNGVFTTAKTSVPLNSSVPANSGPGSISIHGFTVQQSLPFFVNAFLLDTTAFNFRNGLFLEGDGVDFTTSGANTDYGFYYGQYYRQLAYTANNPDVSKYGNRTESVYFPTGSFVDIDQNSPAFIEIFGGDVFTQKSYLKIRGGGYGINGQPGLTEGGGGIGFYSQNVVNTNMIRTYNTPLNAYGFPHDSMTSWLINKDFGTLFAPYNKGYNIVNGITADAAFDPNLPDQSDLPTEIRYSDLKPQNAIVDNYRIFLPLNFLDLPPTDGEISHHENFNGELVTFQLRRVQRQYFNTRGTINVDGTISSEAVIGDGTVLSRPGQTITVIGTNNKWSIVKGKSAQGNDVLYWINTELKKAMRWGADGTIAISDIHNMQSFFANNLTWVTNKDTPADGQGICGVWDDRYMAVLWTIRGKRSIAPWSNIIEYSIGNVVFFVPTTFSTFEKTGEFYVSLVDLNVGDRPDTHPDNWGIIPHQGSVVYNGVTYNANDYYNEYTIEFNEQKNKFTTYYSFLPKIYLKWTDTFLTPRPISNTGGVYEHRLGNYCVWYNDGVTNQTENAFVELLFNMDESLMKQFFAVLINSAIVPYRIDFTTQNQQTFAVSADFEKQINFWLSSIKNDILTSSDGTKNDEDTSRSFGQWIKIKITLQSGQFQKVVDTVVKFLAISRLYTK